MIEPIRIALLIATNQPGAEFHPSVEAWWAGQGYEAFADELAVYAGAPVPVIRDLLAAAPRDGYVIAQPMGGSLDDCQEELRARLVPMHLPRSTIFEVLRRYRLPAAISTEAWASGRALGPHGLAALAPAIGARCGASQAYHQGDYCMLESERHDGLAHLLVDYLRAHRATQRA